MPRKEEEMLRKTVQLLLTPAVCLVLMLAVCSRASAQDATAHLEDFSSVEVDPGVNGAILYANLDVAAWVVPITANPVFMAYAQIWVDGNVVAEADLDDLTTFQISRDPNNPSFLVDSVEMFLPSGHHTVYVEAHIDSFSWDPQISDMILYGEEYDVP